MKSVLSPGESATMPSTSTASPDGWRRGKFVRLIIETGSSKSMESETKKKNVYNSSSYPIEHMYVINKKKQVYVLNKLEFEREVVSI